jgi:hypothetical protein
MHTSSCFLKVHREQKGGKELIYRLFRAFRLKLAYGKNLAKSKQNVPSLSREGAFSEYISKLFLGSYEFYETPGIIGNPVK